MRTRLYSKLKSNNYAESCMIDEADRWREGNVCHLGRSAWYAPKGENQHCRVLLNAQKSAEVIVAER